MMDLLRELIEGGYIGQAVIATSVTLAIVILAVRQVPIPEFLIAAWGLIVGWYFRSQAQFIGDKRSERVNRDQ
jgi:hypothetical protein